jgi:flagellar P-ring protein precursor FlgI
MMRKIFILILMVLVEMTMITLPHASAAVRIKDAAQFQGVRDNQLIGYGLVVGLNGTGDKSQSLFTVRSMANLLTRMGIDIKASEVKPKNVAAVIVTATLPPFIKSGARIDVTLSSLGDASSLQGGTLLLTPLQGADGNVYAVAQGPLSVGGFEVGGGGQSGSFGTVARIPQGALIEHEVPVTLVAENIVKLSLKTVDFTTCVRMAEAINVEFGTRIAEAVDGATVQITVPDTYRENIVSFLARIEHVEMQPDARAKIIMNERTGTIVGGKDVKISRISLTHKNINIEIKPEEKEEAPAVEKKPESSNEWQSQGDGIFYEGESKSPRVKSDEITIGEMAQILNSIGVKPPDMMSILQAAKQSGAIQADLEII